MAKNTPFSLQQSLSRRNMLKNGLAALFAGFAVPSLFRPMVAHAVAPAGKTLIAYYSRTGNTRTVAEQIHRRVGGELFEARATHTYPEAYRAATQQARRELDDNFRPALTAQVADLASYNTVFIGYPSWWGTMPMALFTFLESADFSGKQLVPFCTHEGTGLGRGPADMAKLCPGATVLQGFAVRGGSAATAQAGVDKWLTSLSFM